VPLQDIVLKLGRKLLVLFKFILLEQGVVVFSSQPVHQACTTVLGLLSLFPSGFDHLIPHFLPAEARANHLYHNPHNDAFGLPLKVFHRYSSRKFSPPLKIDNNNKQTKKHNKKQNKTSKTKQAKQNKQNKTSKTKQKEEKKKTGKKTGKKKLT
jgi:hypothetical protein